MLADGSRSISAGVSIAKGAWSQWVEGPTVTVGKKSLNEVTFPAIKSSLLLRLISLFV
jgi:hypothetical protein